MCLFGSVNLLMLKVGTVDPVGDFKSLISCQDVDMFDEGM